MSRWKLLPASLILVLSLNANIQAASTEEILVDAVYKLIQRVNLLEGKLQELQSRCRCLSTDENTWSTGSTGNTKKVQNGPRPDLCRVIIGTFRNRKGAERFAREYGSKISACIKIKETACRNWKCFVVFTDVPREQYRKIKTLIPDAFISRTTLHLHTKREQGFSTTTAATGVQN